jgi:pSer/pThr/pTyr-binding forkhead associated (FHA) protein
MAILRKGMSASAPPTLRVSTIKASGERRELLFAKPFRIGRLPDCEVCIDEQHVSRAHAQVAFENGQWWVRDLNSSNGIFVRDQRIQAVPVVQAVTIRLGIAGPEVSLEPQPAAEQQAPLGSDTVVARYVEHYFGESRAGETLGDHTRMVRRAFVRVQSKQRRKYGGIMAVLALAILAAGGYALYLQRQVQRQTAMARNLFYSMKSLDVDIANLEKLVFDSESRQGMEEIRKYRNRRRDLERNYDQFLATLHVYDPKMTEQQRLILRVARIFGECELAMPPGFVKEIEDYIRKWQSSGRLANCVRTAKERGYTVKIAEELLAQGLPPQFFYLALQESDFDPYVSGPVTAKGIAKGIWQFIPETAVKYGLRIGPLVDLRRPDPGDDRHHFDRATKAAAQYLKDLYSTDAQASGFLVMACYNWGEGRVLPLVRSMPANPKDRNFWRLLTLYRDKIPPETYNYVFSIASAAVICENPRLFGFNFDSPLAHLEGK